MERVLYSVAFTSTYWELQCLRPGCKARGSMNYCQGEMVLKSGVRKWLIIPSKGAEVLTGQERVKFLLNWGLVWYHQASSLYASHSVPNTYSPILWYVATAAAPVPKWPLVYLMGATEAPWEDAHPFPKVSTLARQWAFSCLQQLFYQCRTSICWAVWPDTEYRIQWWKPLLITPLLWTPPTQDTILTWS